MELLTTEEAAKILRVNKATLIDWRYKRKGPPITRVGRFPMYRRDLLDRWIAAQTERELLPQ